MRKLKESKSFEGDFDLMAIILNFVMNSQRKLKNKPEDKNAFLSALKQFSILNRVNKKPISCSS
jgi:hypothetical protein